MNVYSAFWKALRSRPLEAMGALYWHVTGRKVRARNRLRISLAQSPHAYSVWMRTIERNDLAAAAAPAAMAQWRHRPTFSVIVHHTADRDGAAIDALIGSMRSQLYPAWEVVIVAAPDAAAIDVAEAAGFRIAAKRTTSPSEALRIGAETAVGDYLLPLSANATLPSTCLYRFAEALQHRPGAKLVYGDNDWIDPLGERRRPWFKSEWNLDLALAQDYLSQAMIVSRIVLSDRPPARTETAYGWALDIGAAYPDDVLHVPHIQSHLHGTETPESAEGRLPVVQDHLDRTNSGAIARAERHGIIGIDWPLPERPPLVSIVVPTRDKVALLRACIDSLIERTSYQPFEILIVDNGSSESSALLYLDQIARHPAVRVIRDDRPYNFSQLNNSAIAQANGTYLCCLNNDTEIVDGGWLTAMMRQAVRPDVGAVGARLLYADRSLQHAGVVIGMGGAAGHAHRFLPSEEIGYFGRSHAAHRVSAVTAACLVVSKDKFLSVGGFDEKALAIAFNDVDLCLRLQAAGWHNVYTPDATLLHHESKSRGKDTSPQHIERYRRELAVLQERWATSDYRDPLHHPNLDASSETYLIKL